jgi:hypothetical protein
MQEASLSAMKNVCTCCKTQSKAMFPNIKNFYEISLITVMGIFSLDIVHYWDKQDATYFESL